MHLCTCMCSCVQQARNEGDTPLVTTTEATIVLLDENDVTPFFPTSPEVVTVTEGAAIDTVVRLEMEGCAFTVLQIVHGTTFSSSSNCRLARSLLRMKIVDQMVNSLTPLSSLIHQSLTSASVVELATNSIQSDPC